ncbi:MAG: phosphoglycerate dehydrogenase [Limnochordales bacterium]|nr:phosphoglycerate dehydrogenase [Limnochordales bacterium]
MELAVLVSDPLSEEGLAVLRRDPRIRVDVRTGLSPEQLLQVIGEYDGLIVRSQTRVTEEVLEAGKRLKIVGRAGVGVDNIDVPAATRRGILVVNAPEGNTIAAAELTFALLLAVARHVPQAYVSLVKEKKWDRHSFMGVQLQGKVLGILGLGRIGTAVARRAQAFEMRVLAYDPFVSAERASELGIDLVDVDTICREADFITVHTPLTPQTRGLINRERIQMMKPTVRLINCARGGIIDEEALAEALASGRIAGAALDVFSKEPATDNPLLDLPNVVATPHLGASTREAQVNVAIDVAEDFLRFVKGEPVRNPVNAPALRPEVAAVLEPYRQLAQRLGRLYATVVGKAYPGIQVVYRGPITRYDLRPLTCAVLAGMLEPFLHEEVNLVNAPVLAEERGIRLAEVREGDGRIAGAAEGGENGSTITIRVQVDGQVRSVGGTVTTAVPSGNPVPRLIEIDGYRVDIVSSGYLLLSYHIDQPGIIGQVGTILGRHNINIAYMQVGRKASRGGRAVMAMGIDDPVPPEVLQEISRVPGLEATYLTEW